MIIFINGAFGVGKSSVTDLLATKIPNSLLFGAEEVGYMLRNIYKSIDNPDDFQDLQAWRTLAVQTADALKKQYDKTLIMPMCIWNSDYFDEIITGLKSIDKDFYHSCLIASRNTIINRLNTRNDSIIVIKWATERLDKCVESYKSNKFTKKIDTDNKSAGEVTEEIIKLLSMIKW